MRLLLDTHIVLAFLRQEFDRQYPELHGFFSSTNVVGLVSVASLWEIAIKSRLGKLDPGMPLENMSTTLEEADLSILRIDIPHVITAAEPEPETRDPFDRLLLAQCQTEGLLLVTVDRALTAHPLAFRF